MIKFNRRRLFLLKIRYAFTYRMTGYLKWKEKALELFSSVHDLDTLARIMRRKKLAAEKNSENASTVLVGSIIAYIIKYLMDAISNIQSLSDMIDVFKMYPILTFILSVIFFVVLNSNDTISFYDECLTIIKYLDEHSTK